MGHGCLIRYIDGGYVDNTRYKKQRPWKRNLANANAVRRLLINARIVASADNPTIDYVPGPVNGDRAPVSPKPSTSK